MYIPYVYCIGVSILLLHFSYRKKMSVDTKFLVATI